jgi:homoserine dehydrogenase
MEISICLLGFGKVGKAFYKQIKEVPGFGEDFRVHTVVITDLEKHPEVGFNDMEAWSINDETFNTSKQTSIGDDIEWLLESDGHDVLVDTFSFSEESKDLTLKLLSKGYWLYTCNTELAKNHWKDVLDVAEKSNAKVDFNAVACANPAQESLTHENWHHFVEVADTFAKGPSDPEDVAASLLKHILTELETRRAYKAKWDSLSIEEQERRIAGHGE